MGQGLAAKAGQVAKDAKETVRGTYNAVADKLPEAPFPATGDPKDTRPDR